MKSGYFKHFLLIFTIIKHILFLSDLILEAKSGTGKTAVFSIVALEKLDLQKGLQTIVLAPTREIAAQVCDVVKQIGCCYEGILSIHKSFFS